MKNLLLILLLLLPFSGLFAQSDFDEDQYSGCHSFKKIALQNAPSPLAENAFDHNARSDTFDILNYDILLDVTNFVGKAISGTTTILAKSKMQAIGDINFDLEKLTVDSVTNAAGLPLAFSHKGPWLNIQLPAPLNIDDETTVKITYHGQPKTCDCGFGGFYFEGGNAYNLGIGLTEIPPNFGRTWFPCFDSFRERATYDLHIRSNAGKRAFCSGDFLSEINVGGDTIQRNYRMNLPLPTYLLGVAVGNYAVVKDSYTGSYGTHPIELVAKPVDTTDLKNSFSKLKDAVAAFEAWYGPYLWGRIGFVGTQRGAMEHSNNIAYPDFAFDGTQTNAGLMAHEFAHHWWGNITSPALPTDMWVKEGGAEYGSHLFTEKSAGRAAFEQKVKDNTKFVIRNAHKDDGGYLALSPMPQPQTYGTHTYNKGAMVYHNLRGYLGDSLYRDAMSALLVANKFVGLDAPGYRDFLTNYTGKDLAPFFNAWIFSPGFSVFEIDSFSTAGGTSWKIFIQQKKHHAPNFHQAVPLQLTFRDAAWNRVETTVETTGEFTTATVDLPAGFTPVFAYLNENQRLNYATYNTQQVVKAPTAALANLPHVDMQLRILAIPAGDSAFIQVQHQLGGADPMTDPPAGFVLSKTHYWKVGGLWPTGLKCQASLNYNGTSANTFLDQELIANGEDSIGLVWRPLPGEAWQKYPFYTKNIVGATNGFGVIKIDTLLPGDYAFANGSPEIVATNEPNTSPDFFKIWPNPASDWLNFEATFDTKKLALVEIFDAAGKLVRSEKMNAARLNSLKINELPVGSYSLRLFDKNEKQLQAGQFMKQK